MEFDNNLLFYKTSLQNKLILFTQFLSDGFAQITTNDFFSLIYELLQTPDDGFSSINKLAGFLTGTKKKAEIQDEDGDDTESRNLPPPKPVTTKKKDIVDSPSVLKHIDENARNVSQTYKDCICLYLGRN